MPSKQRRQRRQRHALNQRAYQNGFEAGADEAAKRWSEKLDQAQKTIKELEVKLNWQQREARRLNVASDFMQTLCIIIDP